MTGHDDGTILDGDRGALMVDVLPAMEADPMVAGMIRRRVAEEAAAMGGRLTDDPPSRTVVPAHDSPEGPVPEMVRLVFAMVRL